MRFQKLWEKKDKIFFFFFFGGLLLAPKHFELWFFSSGYKLEEETGAFQKRSSHHFRFLELWKSRHLKKNLKTQQKPSSPPVGFKQRLQNHLQAFCGWQSFPLTHLRPKKKLLEICFLTVEENWFQVLLFSFFLILLLLLLLFLLLFAGSKGWWMDGKAGGGSATTTTTKWIANLSPSSLPLLPTMLR